MVMVQKGYLIRVLSWKGKTMKPNFVFININEIDEKNYSICIIEENRRRLLVVGIRHSKDG